MVQLVEYRAHHLDRLKYQPSQEYLRAALPPGTSRAFENTGAVTMLDDDGEVIGCGGLQTMWAGRYAAWLMLSEFAGRHMVPVYRAIEKYLDAHSWMRRIEATVHADFPPGHRLVHKLGFRLETPDGMPGYGLGGETCDLYARVNP